MAQSNLEVSNAALYKLGTQPIVTLADNVKEALACTARIDICKRAVLRMHPWNFAVSRKRILPYQNVAISNVTFVSSQLIEVTAATTGLVDGNYATISGVAGASGANGVFEVATVPTPSTVIRLTAPAVTTSDLLGTYVASDSDYIRRSPAFDFPYLYSLPSDCLRVLRVNDQTSNPSWRVESGKIAADDSTLELKYVYDVTDYTTMDVLFYECLAVYLAWDLCLHLTADNSLKAALRDDLRMCLAKARHVDSTEDSVEALEASDWINSRSTGSAGGAIVGTTLG